MFINRWLLSNPLTDCLTKEFQEETSIDYVHLIYVLGHTFNGLGCFLLDLLPYRNKSDSLLYGLLFPRFKSFDKACKGPPK